MKKLLLSLFLAFAGTTVWAETALFVHQKNGGLLEISFSEKPVVTYSDGYVVVRTADASVSYPISNMQKFTFGEVDDQVTRITAPADAAPQPTNIYSLDGKLLRTYKPGEDGRTSTSLEGLPAGTYVIQNGTTSYKMLKR